MCQFKLSHGIGQRGAKEKKRVVKTVTFKVSDQLVIRKNVSAKGNSLDLREKWKFKAVIPLKSEITCLLVNAVDQAPVHRMTVGS